MKYRITQNKKGNRTNATLKRKKTIDLVWKETNILIDYLKSKNNEK